MFVSGAGCVFHGNVVVSVDESGQSLIVDSWNLVFN